MPYKVNPDDGIADAWHSGESHELTRSVAQRQPTSEYQLAMLRSILRRVYFVLFACTSLAGCGTIEWQDVSADPQYSKMPGREFTLKEDVWVFGIASDQNYQERVDYSVLVPGVGFDGPEVVTRRRAEKGLVFKITKVVAPKLRLRPSIQYEVEQLREQASSVGILRVRVSGSILDSNLGLDPTAFQVVGR
jgi:hypothetical protein